MYVGVIPRARDFAHIEARHTPAWKFELTRRSIEFHELVFPHDIMCKIKFFIKLCNSPVWFNNRYPSIFTICHTLIMK